MESVAVERAVSAARSLAVEAKLLVERATVIQNSNKLAVRLLPCDVLARVAVVGQEAVAFEVEVARRLANQQTPAAALEARVEPRVYRRDGFAVTFWTYYERQPRELGPEEYADALQRLHAGMRTLDVVTPHCTDRIVEAERLVANRDGTPALTGADREVLMSTLQSVRCLIEERGAPEQVLHGEPHPGNVLGTEFGPLFIDFETCCRGPIEFDVAHVPDEVSAHYPHVDRDLLHECRRLVLAMVATWRWDARDQFPNGQQSGRHLLNLLRAGPPWPAIGLLASE